MVSWTNGCSWKLGVTLCERTWLIDFVVLLESMPVNLNKVWKVDLAALTPVNLGNK